MTLVKENRFVRMAVAGMLALVLALTMMPFAPMQQALADPNDPTITIVTGTYTGSPGDYQFQYDDKDPLVVDLRDIDGVDVYIDSPYISTFWNNGGTHGPVWRTAACTEYVSVDELIVWATSPSGGGLPGGWTFGHVLGFRTTEETGIEDYPLYVAEYWKISTDIEGFSMGFNTQAQSVEFGNNSTTYPFTDIKLEASGDNPPRAVLGLNVISETVGISGQWAYNNWGHSGDEPLRYLEGASIDYGRTSDDMDLTWGRRLPQRVAGLIIATPAT